MCGIACYVGSERKVSFLIDKLSRLEYRGYDSAGYTSLEKNAFLTKKAVGKLQNLKNLVLDSDKTTCAISHTRWATHGECSVVNAHPHLSHGEEWAVVHNGIIENYLDLKSKLQNLPESTTDTAVLAELLEEASPQNVSEFIDVMCGVRGSYALVAMQKNQADTLFFAKDKSPMFIAVTGAGDAMIASDPICFDGFAEEYYIIEDGEFGIIKNKKILVLNSEKNEVKKVKNKLAIGFENATKEGYPHFMLKEIMEESDVLKNQVRVYRERQILKPFTKEFLSWFKKIVFVGCGTAYHAGLMGTYYVKEILKMPSEAIISSEFLCEDESFLNSETLYIFVSQSGETADTLQALEKVKRLKATTIALTNVMYSTISRRADFVLPTCAGKEIAVASTKAYICQLSAIYMFCKNAKDRVFDCKNPCYSEILRISDKILTFNREQIENIAKQITNVTECVFIGKQADFVTALECSLKLKEVSYIGSSAYPSGELKHGYLAIIEKGTPVFVFAGNEKFNAKTISSAEEAEARGAKIILLSNEQVKSDLFDEIIFIDEQNPLLAPMLATCAMQYLAYYVSISKNINPDMPRNLAKSVTVE